MTNQKHAGISVVVPARNEEERLGHCLFSLLEQTVLPGEVIVVNNASLDETKKIAVTFANSFFEKNIIYKIVDQPIQGIAKARNTGFYKSKYPIIASTDADATVHFDWIENIQKHFSFYDSIAVTGKIIMIDAPLLIKSISQLGGYKMLTDVGEVLVGFRTLHTANAAVKKKAFVSSGGFNENIVSGLDIDDTDLSSRLFHYGNIRFDNSLIVDTSFRKYQTPEMAFNTIIRRLKAWGRITKEFRKSLKEDKLINLN